MTRLPRILTDVPQLPHVHLEIAKAIRGWLRRLRKSGGSSNKASPSSVQTMTSASSSFVRCCAT